MLYTDGLVEVPGRDIDVGIDRLLGDADRLVTADSERARPGWCRRCRAAGASSDDCALALIWRS